MTGFVLFLILAPIDDVRNFFLLVLVWVAMDL
jgi:hypothetical protein